MPSLDDAKVTLHLDSGDTVDVPVVDKWHLARRLSPGALKIYWRLWIPEVVLSLGIAALAWRAQDWFVTIIYCLLATVVLAAQLGRKVNNHRLAKRDAESTRYYTLPPRD